MFIGNVSTKVEIIKMFPYELEVMDVVFIFFCEIWARFNVEQGFVQGIHGQNDVQDTK